MTKKTRLGTVLVTILMAVFTPLSAVLVTTSAAQASTAAPASTATVDEIGINSHGWCSHSAHVRLNGIWRQLPSIGFGGNTHCIMGQGANHRGVEVLQRALVECNGQGLVIGWNGIDGIYGPNTAQAVRNVQQREGIAVDGVYGPQTRNAMFWGPIGHCDKF